ncbi:MAG: cyclic nucleotide-binding domain-containing protein [Alphaproteobacteria bacterium]|nr:cyclic nucleotide-binding domain-containing protein [Alphaproteobacteria bacterium]
MRRSDIEQVRSLPLFREMTKTHFSTLMSAALLQKFPARTVLIREGELPDFLHIVVEGTVELYSRWEDRETTIDIIRPVTTFILAAVIQDDVYLKSARTIDAARILMIPSEAIRDIFGRDAGFARAIVSELALRYRGIVRVLKDRKLRTSVERLANWILAMDRSEGGGGRIVLAHDKRTLSSRLGMTPENLSRSLAILGDHGVEGTGREIVIVDREALQRCAKPSPLIDG